MILGASNSEEQMNTGLLDRGGAVGDASLEYERLAEVLGMIGWCSGAEVVAAFDAEPRSETIRQAVDSVLMSNAAITGAEFELLLSLRNWPWPVPAVQAATLDRLVRRSRVAGQWSAS
jgi:hypothetical protein